MKYLISFIFLVLFTISSYAGGTIAKDFKKAFKKGKTTIIESYLDNWVELDVLLEQFTAHTRVESERVPKILAGFIEKGSKVKIIQDVIQKDGVVIVMYKRKTKSHMRISFYFRKDKVIYMTIEGYETENKTPLKKPNKIRRFGGDCN